MKTMSYWCGSFLEEKKKGGAGGEQGWLGNGRGVSGHGGQLINNCVGLVTCVLVTVACLCSVSTALDVEPCQTWSTESNALPPGLLFATDSTRYTPYAPLRVTITGVFNRVVMQARVIGSSNGTVGIFTDLPDSSETHSCEVNHDTFIYESVTNISSLSVTWIAPARSHGDVELVARVSTEESNSWWTVTSLVIHDNVSLYADHLGTNFSLMLMDIDGNSYQPEAYIITPSTVPIEVNIATGFQTHHSSLLASRERPGFDRLSSDSRLRSSTLERKALSISASEEIGIVVVNKEEYSIDGFLSLPDDALGTEYFAVSYSPSGLHHSQIGAVPTEDDTVVSFALPPNRPITVQFRNRVYNSGMIITVRMDLLDAIQIQSNDDLTGTRVYSNKPIAVFSGNDDSSVGGHNSTEPHSTDHMVEQLVPVKSWGQTFAIVPFPDRTNGNIIRVVASEQNTSVVVSSDLTETLLNPGDFVDVEVFHFEVYYWLESNKPVQVVQFSKSHVPAGGIADTAMSLQPSIDQQSNNYRFITPDGSRGFFETNYMLIVIEETNKDGIYIEGIAFGKSKISDLVNWKAISGSKPAMVATAVQMRMDVFHVYHETSDVTFQLVLTGHGDKECYAMPMGLRLYDTNVKECVPQPQSVLDGIDNDCDGEIDEEECDREDDDGDGYVDEDCSVHITTASMEETSELPFTADRGVSSTTHQADSLNDGQEDDKFSLLELCAMGAGGLLILIIFIVLLVCCLRKRRNRDRPTKNETEMEDLPSRSPSVTASISTISHGDGRGTSSLGQAPSILSSGYHSDAAVEEEEEEFETIYPTDDFQESEHSDGTV